MEEDKVKKVIELVKENPVLTSIEVAHESDVSTGHLTISSKINKHIDTPVPNVILSYQGRQILYL